MSVRGLRKVKKARQVSLAGRRGKEVPATNDLVHSHEAIIHDHDELVGKHPIASPDEKVPTVCREVLVIVAVDSVANGDLSLRRACVGHLETRGGMAMLALLAYLLRSQVAARALIDERAVRGVGCRGGMELRPCAEAWVGEALRGKGIDCPLIDVQAVALEVGSLVPVEAEPFVVAHQVVRYVAVLCPGVDVLDAEDHPTVPERTEAHAMREENALPRCMWPDGVGAKRPTGWVCTTWAP